MLITREMLVKKLAKKSDFYEKHVRVVLQCLDDVILDCFDEVTDEEEISVQLVQGIKVGCKVMGERTRKDPRNQQEIVCAAQTKPFAKFSEGFRVKIQKQYEY